MDKRILVIDDVRSFPHLHKDNDVTYARTAERAIELIDEFDWDEIYWDHDLSWDDWEDTSIPAALHFVSEPRNIGKIVIHTANYDGRVRLTYIFQDAGYSDIIEQRWVHQMGGHPDFDGLPYELQTEEQYWGCVKDIWYGSITGNLQDDVERYANGKSILI